LLERLMAPSTLSATHESPPAMGTHIRWPLLIPTHSVGCKRFLFCVEIRCHDLGDINRRCRKLLRGAGGLITTREAMRQKRVSPVAAELTPTPVLSQAKHRIAMISRTNPVAVRSMHRLVHLSRTRSRSGGNELSRRHTWTMRASRFITERSRTCWCCCWPFEEGDEMVGSNSKSNLSSCLASLIV